MKRLLPLLILFLIIATNLNSQNIQLPDAERIAHNCFFEQINKYHDAVDYTSIDMELVFTSSFEDKPLFHAFENRDGGFVIVAAQQVIQPVIGYSFTGDFPEELDPKSNFGSLMAAYAEMMEYALENNITSSAEVMQSWAHLLTNDPARLNTTSRDKDVEPLIASMWNQDYPYNIMSPEDPEGPGGHAYAGCVATAMSQVMHYWRYPLTGVGSHSYHHNNYGQLSADFGATEYDWAGMLNLIDFNDPWAIAELQYHAGVGVEMNFSPNGSGSNMFMARDALQDYFRYADCKLKFKENYTEQEWIDLLKNQIDQEYPVNYAGYSNSGGHAFVCDGYQDDYFHFNFGWGGASNGYYSLSNVNGFSNGQQGVIDFYPTQADYPYHVSGDHVFTKLNGSFTDGSGPVSHYLNNKTASWLIDPQTEEDSVSGIELNVSRFELGNNDILRIYDGGTSSAPLIGEYTGDNVPGKVSSAGNKLLVVFESDGSETGPGFYAEYRSIIPEYCQSMAVITAPAGTITDGSGNFNYNNNTLCYFQIKPETDKNILISFKSFETEEENDKLLIYDSNELIGTFSGDSLPDVVEVTSGTAILIFKTSSYVTAGGWEIEYQTGYLAMDENSMPGSFEIYPNPSQGNVQLEFQAEESTSYQLSVQDVSGAELFHETFNAVTGKLTKQIQLEELDAGLYFVTINSKAGSITNKLVISK
ncbi:MAG: C10 family peptidase [Bacteroidales bacterium]|nr:C10 family peptidase [Bacteroidales bacterium]MCF8343989.1 C10 family peptidase [Bacteroidales bacterium]MCF8350413.1 C10 family peptidase [Bacteroidales bacterium]MCF8377775.1 C10 family peptidase [Bacteroidales bacterium]